MPCPHHTLSTTSTPPHLSRHAKAEFAAAGLTDLPATLADSDLYTHTYIYEGNSQVLDHRLISRALVTAGYAFDVAHTNSEFTTRPTDHVPQIARLTIP
ncbi:hypothetical protein J7I98_37175 [Streptomyces sp. ISL-98]|uniref:hypothetical protein n=1 Tax=Streptomyces sp. ISL-98 TaxID=2819192 RepID=UPI001BEA085D|nr:hypothetical protein [Streptomyces sp. ISL-98]MBT2511354.1 hypothetical protein [Streptomyces sp. ISL-98]